MAKRSKEQTDPFHNSVVEHRPDVFIQTKIEQILSTYDDDEECLYYEVDKAIHTKIVPKPRRKV